MSVKVLIVDDMRLAQKMVKAMLETDPEICVVGTAGNGKEGIEMAAKLQPDLIIMDIHMPVMDGLEATRHVMQFQPVPILMMSSSAIIVQRNAAFEALRIGALDIMEKPDGSVSADLKRIGAELITRVKRLSRIKVIRHVTNTGRPCEKTTESFKIVNQRLPARLAYDLVAIGASTGGPAALVELLADFPADFPVPIVIVQHMSSQFIDGFAEWMGKNLALPVKLAEEREILRAPRVYIAPALRHLAIKSNLQVVFTPEPAGSFNIPSVDVLFQSTAECLRQRAIGILLTGMGDDGARGLLAMREQGGKTFAQDEDSCVVFGMPQKARQLGAVDHNMKLSHIAREVIELCCGRKT